MVNIRLRICPNCNVKLIEDAFEKVKEQDDGTIHQEIIYPAFICSNFCGYYEEIDERRT